jgi:hypothetical protein
MNNPFGLSSARLSRARIEGPPAERELVHWE